MREQRSCFQDLCFQRRRLHHHGILGSLPGSRGADPTAAPWFLPTASDLLGQTKKALAFTCRSKWSCRRYEGISGRKFVRPPPTLLFSSSSQISDAVDIHKKTVNWAEGIGKDWAWSSHPEGSKEPTHIQALLQRWNSPCLRLKAQNSFEQGWLFFRKPPGGHRLYIELHSGTSAYDWSVRG